MGRITGNICQAFMILPRAISLFFTHALFVTISAAQSVYDSSSVKVPGRIVLPAELRTTIDAKDSGIGKEIELVLIDEVRDTNEKILIPSQAKLKGHVTEAVPWTKDKPESKVSIVVESAEWKGHSVVLHAFIAGDLRVYSSLAHPDPNDSSIVATHETVQIGAGHHLHLPLPSGPGIVWDKAVSLQFAISHDLVTEVVSKTHTVRMEQGSTFSLRQLSP